MGRANCKTRVGVDPLPDFRGASNGRMISTELSSAFHLSLPSHFLKTVCKARGDKIFQDLRMTSDVSPDGNKFILPDRVRSGLAGGFAGCAVRAWAETNVKKGPV